jgi:hypothetical protein
MEKKIIENINKQIAKKFPETAGIKPSLRKQALSEKKQKSPRDGEARNYLLTYKFTANGPGGQKIPRWVRVIATPEGKVIKITTSK